MHHLNSIKYIIKDILSLDENFVVNSNENTSLLGSIPEFDSMAVISLISALEDEFDIFVEDDEISAETFETIGSLLSFVNKKIDD